MREILSPLIFAALIILKNPWKMIMIVFAIFFWTRAGTIPDTIYEVKVLKEIRLGEKWVYLVDGGGDEGIEAWEYSEKKKLHNGSIVQYQYSGGNVALWFGFWMVASILVIASFDWAGIDSSGWSIQEPFSETIGMCTRCEIEDGHYVYTVFGRLISKERSQRNFEWFRMSEVMTLPRYKTRSIKRKDAFDKLGI